MKEIDKNWYNKWNGKTFYEKMDEEETKNGQVGDVPKGDCTPDPNRYYMGCDFASDGISSGAVIVYDRTTSTVLEGKTVYSEADYEETIQEFIKKYERVKIVKQGKMFKRRIKRLYETGLPKPTGKIKLTSESRSLIKEFFDREEAAHTTKTLNECIKEYQQEQRNGRNFLSKGLRAIAEKVSRVWHYFAFLFSHGNKPYN